MYKIQDMHGRDVFFGHRFTSFYDAETMLIVWVNEQSLNVADFKIVKVH